MSINRKWINKLWYQWNTIHWFDKLLIYIKTRMNLKENMLDKEAQHRTVCTV